MNLLFFFFYKVQVHQAGHRPAGQDSGRQDVRRANNRHKYVINGNIC